MPKLLIASHNPDKINEIRDLLLGLDVQLFSLRDFPALAATEEDRDTLCGNAMKKALEAAQQTGLLCLADDTGLFIEALNGEPGIYAARYAGADCNYSDNRQKVLRLLQNETHRKAEFRTCAALAAPDGVIACTEGLMSGAITTAERGDNGFGYDSIFSLDSTRMTYAEMSDAQKNSVSHRALALQKMLPIIKDIFSL